MFKQLHFPAAIKMFVVQRLVTIGIRRYPSKKSSLFGFLGAKKKNEDDPAFQKKQLETRQTISSKFHGLNLLGFHSCFWGWMLVDVLKENLPCDRSLWRNLIHIFNTRINFTSEWCVRYEPLIGGFLLKRTELVGERFFGNVFDRFQNVWQHWDPFKTSKYLEIHGF